MTRLNISVPDALAEEVRQQDIPISAVCQRALRDEVSRRRETGTASETSAATAIDQVRQGLDYIVSTYGEESMKPTVGRIVHYVSYGTPAGEYKSECRAAVVTAGPHFVSGTFHEGGGEALSLCVLNPEGMFFNQHVLHHDGDIGHDHAGEEIPERSYRGGTWHWPERVP